MEELYIEIKGKTLPIDQTNIEKYNLKKGTVTPFTGNRIVGEFGEFPSRPYEEGDLKRELGEIPEKGYPDGGIDQMDNGFEVSTSEIIDIAQGVDSD